MGTDLRTGETTREARRYYATVIRATAHEVLAALIWARGSRTLPT